MKSIGDFYTWYNNQVEEDRVMCKLDRVLGNVIGLIVFHLLRWSLEASGALITPWFC